MRSEFRSRPLASDERQEAVQLLTLGLGTEIPRTSDFWEWKHQKNPFGPSPVLVAESEDKLIGLRAFLRWIWESDRSIIKAARAVDTVTHPDFQGRNVFRTLTSTLLEQMRAEGVSFIYNTPNRFSLPGYLKMGWKPVGRLPVWFRPINPIRSILRMTTRRRGDIPAKGEPVGEALNQSGIDLCLESFTGEIRLHTPRSLPYLNWRYSDIPGLSYFARLDRKFGDFALIIYRVRTRRGLNELSISEVFSTSSSEGAYIGRNLIEQIVRENDVDYAVAIAADDTPEQMILKDSGFFPINHGGPLLTLKILHELPFNVMDWSNWRCSIGDLELF